MHGTKKNITFPPHFFEARFKNSLLRSVSLTNTLYTFFMSSVRAPSESLKHGFRFSSVVQKRVLHVRQDGNCSRWRSRIGNSERTQHKYASIAHSTDNEITPVNCVTEGLVLVGKQDIGDAFKLQWWTRLTQEAVAYLGIFSGAGGYNRNFFSRRGGQRIQLRTGQRKWGSGGGSPLVRDSTQFTNE
jgi:hypothetical protein